MLRGYGWLGLPAQTPRERQIFKTLFGHMVGYGYLGMKIHILTVQNYHLVRKMISPARA